MAQAPSRYSPYGPNKQALLDRQKTVLDLMADQGYITPAERDAAKKEEVKFGREWATNAHPAIILLKYFLWIAPYPLTIDTSIC